MKIVIQMLVLVCFVALAPSSFSASGESGYGLAWKVSDPGSNKIAHLMGAVHLANEKYYPILDSALVAFDEATVLLVEADDRLVSAEQSQKLLEQYAMYPEGERFSDHLSPQLVDQVDVMFSTLGLLNAREVLARYKPGLLGVTLAALQAQSLGYTPEQGIDNYFISRANDKAVDSIETVESQFKLIDALPLSEETFQDALLDMADYQTEWAEIELAWQKRDAGALYDRVIGNSLKDFPDLADYFEVLFFDRNVLMTDALENCMEKARCFMVVGAGHLVGPRSVTELLVKRGYQVEQLGL